jgi:hypothetical protein
MRRFIMWLTAAIIVTLIFGSLYLTLQRLGRSSANAAPAAAVATQAQMIDSDPPAAPRLELTPDSAVFVLVYGEDDKPVSGTVTLHGSLPVIPSGVLRTARTAGTDTVTWQPERGLRMAVVARSVAGKVVVGGQSLTPFEERDNMVLLFLGFSWLAGMVVLAAGYAGSELYGRRHADAAA